MECNWWGNKLTISAALTGRDVRTLPDFPAEIRAPAGTVAGVSGFQLAMAEHAIFTAGRIPGCFSGTKPCSIKKLVTILEARWFAHY